MSKDRVCAVPGCRRINYYVYKDTDSPPIKFFRFPRRKTTCIKWIEQLNRLDLYPILEEQGPVELWLNYRVCSEHFTDQDFEKPGLFAPRDKKRHRGLLLKSAIPSVNLGDRNEIYIAPGPVIDEDVKEQVICEPLIVEGVVEEEPTNKNEAQVRDLEIKLATAEAKVMDYEAHMKECDNTFKNVEEIMSIKYINFHRSGCNDNFDDCHNDFALDLYLKAPRVYKELQEKYSLPHTSLLYKWKYKKEELMRNNYI